MIKPASRLRLMAVAALLASSLLHVAAMAISPELTQDVQIEGSDTEQSAALGSNFADLVKAGDELNPVETDDSAVATPPVETTPKEPVDTPRETANPVTPVVFGTVSPPPFKIEPVQSESLVASSPVERLASVKPEDATTQTPTKPTEQVDPKSAETPIKPVKPAQTVTPVKKPKPEPAVMPQKQKSQPRTQSSAGSSKTKSRISNKSGSQNGKEQAKAKSSGKSKSKSRSSESGNAAVSNYPGKIYAKIARTRQKNAGGRGVTQVRFNVSSSGKAVGISIARSSGNARIDRAAVAHVKRASPFPKPPPGAQTRYVIPIEFRR